jgi:hypothetical protein
MSDVAFIALLVVICAGVYFGARMSLEPPRVRRRPYLKRGLRR